MRYLVFSSLLLISSYACAQSPAPLNFNSYALKLGIAADGSLALTTRAGEFAIADPGSGQWRKSPPAPGKEFGITLDQSNFFNKDTGFVSGFISSATGKYNIIYHTSDGGKNWKAIDFGQDGWVDDAENLDNGTAWLSVAGSGIAYTTDYGFTWKKLTIPDKKQRFATIFFNQELNGIAGSLWNKLAYTDDNCKNWKSLPTPLDQNKYNKTNKESRPEINRVAIYKDYFFVVQEDMVFYSRREAVDWIWLPEFIDFFTDPENSALFFRNTNGAYVCSDESFKPQVILEEPISAFDAKCKNGNLFIVSAGKMIHIDDTGRVISRPLEETKTGKSTQEPSIIGYTPDGAIGVTKNTAFMQHGYQGAWDSIFIFPFSVKEGVLSLTDENQVLYENNDSLFYFNFSGVLIKTKSISYMIDAFAKSTIRKIVFSQGSQGCFHNDADQLMYTNSGGVFGGAVEIGYGRNSGVELPDNDEEIYEDEVSEFLKSLPAIFKNSLLTKINDLGFKPGNFEQCKKDILDFQKSPGERKREKETRFYFPKNNLDFNRLLSLVDSVKNISDTTLYYFLGNLSDGWSTTTNWKKIELIDDNNETLTISSRYFEPNAFYFPWIVSLNGHNIVTTSIQINRFIEKTYPAFIRVANRDRQQVLHALVKKLY